MEGNTLLAVCSCFTLLLYCGSASTLDSFADAEWPNHGGGIENRREGHHSSKINPETAPKLKLKWRFATNFNNNSDVTTSPSLSDGVVYFPTWDGFLYAVQERNGKPLWQKNLTELTNSSVTYVSRHTPVVSGKYLLVGIYDPAVVLAIDRRNGDLIWSTLLDTSLLALITVSGTVYKSSYYVGVSSLQETLSECCTFQGSFVKIDIHTGKIVWQTKLLPDNGGKRGLYAGAAVWGSSPPIDTKRNLVYIATGNLYQVPPEVEECESKQRNKTVPDIPDPCIVPEDHSESILALDLDTGSIKWSHHLGGYDVWRYVCIIGAPANCPDAFGQDFDFGEAPMMLRIPKRNSPKLHDDADEEDEHEEWRDIVVAGQKSGFVWALDRDDGQIIWGTAAGPGGYHGGASWGSATDSHRVYTNIINDEHKNFTLLPSTKVTLGGGWVALDAPTGTMLWSTATPDATATLGPVCVTNGVVFVTSIGYFHGYLYALEAKSGRILWQHRFPGSITAGVSIHHNCVFLGEGIHFGQAFNHSTKGFGGVSAFCL